MQGIQTLVNFIHHGGTTPRDVEIRKKIYRILGMEDYWWIC